MNKLCIGVFFCMPISRERWLFTIKSYFFKFHLYKIFPIQCILRINGTGWLVFQVLRFKRSILCYLVICRWALDYNGIGSLIFQGSWFKLSIFFYLVICRWTLDYTSPECWIMWCSTRSLCKRWELRDQFTRLSMI